MRFATKKLLPILRDAIKHSIADNPDKGSIEIDMLPVLRKACIFTLRNLILDDVFSYICIELPVKEYNYNRRAKVLHVRLR